MSTSADRLTRPQVRILFGACVAVGVAYMQPATINYMVTPMLTSLGSGETDAGLLRDAASIASLLVIFPAAALAGRLGQRRLIGIGAGLFVLGSVLVAVASVLWMAVAGLALQAVGGTAMIVVPLSVISSAVAGAGPRATAFAMFSMVGRLVWVFMPVLAALLMEDQSWRLVAGSWAVGGVLAYIAVRWSLAPDGPDRTSAELLTPFLASLACVGLAQWAEHSVIDGWLSSAALARAAVCIVALATLLLALRRVRRPSLDIGFLRRPGVWLMLLVFALWCVTQLWYYVTLALEFVYDYSVLQTALLMVPVQACAVLGALSGGRISRRLGLTVSGFWLLVFAGIALALGGFVMLGWPTWALLTMACAYSFAALAAGVPMTTSIMDAARAGDDNGASAFRQSAIAVGTALGISALSGIALLTFANSYTATAAVGGLDDAQADQMAQSIWSGATRRQVSREYHVSGRQVRSATAEEKQAYLDSVSATCATSAAASFLAAGIFLAARRRMKTSADRSYAKPL